MAAFTQPLRDEHKELRPHVDMLRTVADSIGIAPIESLRQGLDEVCAFLTHQLIPHAEEVGKLTEELVALRAALAHEPLGATNANDLRRVLYGLYALVSVHFAKEEEIYLPILDARLTVGTAQKLFAAMEEAAHEAKGDLTH